MYQLSPANAQKLRHVLILAASIILTACSGGGSTADQQAIVPTPAPAPEPAPLPSPEPEPPMTSSPDYLNFETVPTRPLLRLNDVLYVTNPRNNRIESFQTDTDGTLVMKDSLPVGLEPVALAARNGSEIWVVNHLSDSVSIIDVSRDPARIIQTLLVGDEPRDIVFANDRAFITTAHRGQHRTHASLAGIEGAGDPQTHQQGIARADVWVFDAETPGVALGGLPLKIIEMFGDSPRALATNPDGSIVYAAVFHSGNQTSIVHEGVMCYGFIDDDPSAPFSGAIPCELKDQINSPNGLPNGMLPGGRPAPGENADGVAQPWTSMIVKYDRQSGEWRDPLNRNFSNAIRFNLPDQDVFAIDTASLSVVQDFRHVGTTLFNMAVNPVTGSVYVSNTDSQNHIRFEGPGVHGGSTVQGNIAQARITVLNPDTAAVTPRHLNKHIDYTVLKAPAETKRHSLATPQQLIVSVDGSKAYVAAMGSNAIGVYDTHALEDDASWSEADPSELREQTLNVAGGPIGLLLDEVRERLLVYTHIDHAVSVIDLDSGNERQRVALTNPEPAAVTAGRFMLYDAKRTSSNGEASCASCHVFGDLDQLSWNLGNPDESNSSNPQPQPTRNLTELSCDIIGPNDPFCSFLSIVNGDGNLDGFASMKGPMTTQTLRGTSTHGHMHWRGDRSNGYFGVDNEQSLDERLSIKNFIVAYEGLLGLDVDLPASTNAANKSAAVITLEQDMDRFADFALSIQLPPNPHVGLDRTHSASARLGRDFFLGNRRSDGIETDTNSNGPEADGVNCAGCHTLSPLEGHFGTNGNVAHGGEILMLKVPHLRNLYQKVGMFGLPDRESFLPSTTRNHQGDQIRGFGFLHDGATDRLFNFLQGAVFDNGEQPCAPGTDSSHGCETNLGVIGIPSDEVRLGLADFLMEFDSDLPPVTGQQMTLTAANTSAAVISRLNLLEQRASSRFQSKVLGGDVNECDLTVLGVINDERVGYLYDAVSNTYLANSSTDQAQTSEALRSLATATEANTLTFTCVPPGSGRRIALDNNRDGVLDRDQP